MPVGADEDGEAALRQGLEHVYASEGRGGGVVGRAQATFEVEVEAVDQVSEAFSPENSVYPQETMSYSTLPPEPPSR